MSRVRPGYLLDMIPALPSSAQIDHRRKIRLAMTLERTLDRVNVLGNDRRQGHTGCVNALSWAKRGELLISGGDDTTLRIWKMDTNNITQEYPFTSRCVVWTGHGANIFSAKMLPYSSRIATAAGDNQVRVFDVNSALPGTAADQEAQLASESYIKIICCHTERAKKIVTEDSPDLFLSVSEDGTVRQHDLRAPGHSCGRSYCPAPLVKMDEALCTLSLSPLMPHQFVVAGGPSSHGYLYDRRHCRLALEATWGGIPRTSGEMTTCVRRFGRKAQTGQRQTHITGARMSPSNGHEVLLSYSGDGIYLFSVNDEPADQETGPSAIVPPNDHRDEDSVVHEEASSASDFVPNDTANGSAAANVPIILPRRHYTGSRNVDTVKDVNFLGPNDEWVTSGSDDGNFFIWRKLTGSLHGIYEGDSSVVNMVEGHPELPLIAVSGIDTTVKLFAPTHGESAFSRVEGAERIMEMNQRQRQRRIVHITLQDLELFVRGRGQSMETATQMPDCASQ